MVSGGQPVDFGSNFALAFVLELIARGEVKAKMPEPSGRQKGSRNKRTQAREEAAARRVALREYGALASDYVREFDRKWLRGGAAAEEALVGSADIQSLADLAGSYDIVREMTPFPFGRRMLIQLVVVTAAPLAPLVLTVIPLHELMDRLFKVLL